MDMLKALSINQAMDAVEQAYLAYETGRYQMPARMYIGQNDDTLLLMPCFTEKSFGTKVVTVFPGNTKMRVPVTKGIMLLNDRQTGVPVALMNGTVLTAFKTGAVGGVSVRYLADPNAKKAGLIGTGL